MVAQLEAADANTPNDVVSDHQNSAEQIKHIMQVTTPSNPWSGSFYIISYRYISVIMSCIIYDIYI